MGGRRRGGWRAADLEGDAGDELEAAVAVRLQQELADHAQPFVLDLRVASDVEVAAIDEGRRMRSKREGVRRCAKAYVLGVCVCVCVCV